MFRNEIIRTTITVVICCLLFSCAFRKVRTQPPFFDSPTNTIVPTIVLETLRQRADRISTIKSSLTMLVKYKTLAKPEKLTGFIAIGGPGKIRFKGFTLLGLTLFDIAVHNDRVQLFLPGRDELYQGDLKDVYDSPLALPFLPDDISTIFYPETYETSNLECRETEGYYVFRVPIEDITQSRRCRYLWIEKSQLTVHKIEIYTQHGIETVCTLDNYQQINGNYFPFMIEIDRQRDGSHIKIAVNSIKVNDIIDLKAFSIDAKNMKSIKKLGTGK